MYRPSRKKAASVTSSKKMNAITADVEKNENKSSSRNAPTASTTRCKPSKNRPLLAVGLVGLVFVIMVLSSTATKPNRNWWLLVWIASVPVFLAGWVVASAQNATHQRLIALAFVLAIACNQLPSYVSAAIAATSLFLFGIATRPQKNNNNNNKNTMQKQEQNDDDKTEKQQMSLNPLTWPGEIRAIASALLLVVVLLVDNFFVWVVAATNHNSHSVATTPPPLQDNGRLVQEWLYETILQLKRRDLQHLRALFNIQWALVASCVTSMFACELGLVSRRALWSVSMRALIVLSTARVVRVISFLVTVLPSQVPRCYGQRFPNPPPNDWAHWILVGLRPQANGGCNDLVVSGHATVTSVLACLSTSVSGNVWFAMALWTLLVMDYCIEVYEGFHYSVDMWIGGLITSMLWCIIDIEPKSLPLIEVKLMSFQQIVDDIRTIQGFWFALPAVLAFCVIMVFPKFMVNYWVVAFCSYVVPATIKNGFTQYTQHVLLCLLYLTLAVYL